MHSIHLVGSNIYHSIRNSYTIYYSKIIISHYSYVVTSFWSQTMLLRLDCQQLRRTSFDLAFLLKSSSHCVDLSCYENVYTRLASTTVCSNCNSYVIIKFSPAIILPLSEYDCTVFLQIWTGVRSLPACNYTT